MRPTEDRSRFTALFHELSPRVFAYARRQCDAATAEDVVSDTFLVAWRRFEDLPTDPLPWLLVIARNTLSDRRRRTMRQHRLTDTIADLERTVGHAALPTTSSSNKRLSRPPWPSSVSSNERPCCSSPGRA